MRPSLAPVLLAALALSACAAPRSTDEHRPVLRRISTGGAEVRVASYARWNAACEQAGLPTATVVSPPGHGTLVVRPAPVTAGSRLYSGTTNCRDRTVNGIELVYTPERGFRGTDSMGYEISEGGPALPFSATVDVR